MVLGSGLVARGFKVYNNDNNHLVFASGISNSANEDEHAFLRERNLLNEAILKHQEKTFIYFSTCSVYDTSLQDSPYVLHKLAMEALIKDNHTNYHIFRISNLVGNTENPHTVLNFFIQHIISNTFFLVWKNASRNIIDIHDAVAVCDHIIKQDLFKNETVNVANPENYRVTWIIQTIENIVGHKGNYELIDKGSNPEINTADIQKLFTELKIYFDTAYLERTIRKYFAKK